jgi:dephospho-CoA kinase
MARKVQALKRAGGVAIVLAEIPLAVEVGVPPWSDMVVAVEAAEELRLARMTRRGLTPDQVRRRMQRQASDDARRGAADVVVRNDGDLKELQQGARRLWERLFSQGERMCMP